MSLTTDYFRRFAADCIKQASEVADTIQLSESKAVDRYVRASRRSLSVSDDERFVTMDTFFGMKGWAVILSVDIRKSSKRAILLGAKGTYVTMHAALPTLAEAVHLTNGKVIGLRGDGLIASFGLVDLNATRESAISKDAMESAASDATRCAKAMIEAVDDAVEPELAAAGIRSPNETGPLRVGVGIDFGEIVVTKIGFLDAQEVTAYGPPVNWACKHSDGNGEIRVSNRFRESYPTGKGGRVKLHGFGTYFRLEWPHRVLK